MMKLLSLISFVFFSFSSCAVFTFHEEGFRIPVLAKDRSPKKSVTVICSIVSFKDGAEIETRAAAVEAQQKKTAEFFTESGYFTEVKTGMEKSDLTVEVNSVETHPSSGSMWAAFFTGFTLFVLPSYADMSHSITFVFKEKNRTSKEFKRKISFTMWLGWIFLPLMPFKFLTDIDKGMREIHYSVLEEAEKSGLF